MTDQARQEGFFDKAVESLDGASSEYINRRFNNAANRCYYACFQAAVAALLAAGINPSTRNGELSHSYVQAQFAGELINRRKRYPAELRDTLVRLLILRQRADYEPQGINQTQASRALGRTRTFVEAINPRGGEPQ